MEFTGEQLILGMTSKRVMNDHLARYRFASSFVKGKKVLDAACGSGYGTRLLKKAGAEFICGIDKSKEVVLYAQRHHGLRGCEFKYGDVTNLPFENNFFDVVISFETIEHLDEETQNNFLKEIRRVLKENGIFIISTPNKKILAPHKEKSDNPYHLKELYFKELLELIKKHRYEIVDIRGQRIMHKIFTNLMIRRLIEKFEKKFMKRRIKYYYVPTPPQVVHFDKLHEPRYFVLVLRKKCPSL